MMKDNIFPYPCNECKAPYKDRCSMTQCKRYLEWFAEEWELTTKPFRDLARDRDFRKFGKQSPKEITHWEGNK